MGIFQRITTWYFSKNALPYWCVLMLDCAIIVVSGMVGIYIVQGGSPLQGSGFWHYLLACVCALPFFIIGMRVFRTYSGVLRYSSFVDLARVAGALVIGYLISLIFWIFPLPLSNAVLQMFKYVNSSSLRSLPPKRSAF